MKDVVLGGILVALFLIASHIDCNEAMTSYTERATVVEVHGTDVTFDDGTNLWKAHRLGLHKGDEVVLSMDDKGTEDVKDDAILDVCRIHT